jgi:DNA-directed RNA polymerase specialized sigma24 family protein
MLDVPAINSVIEWIHEHSRKNLWRVGNWYDYEDLVYDGLMKALECRAKLGDDVDPDYFVGYVKRAFRNHIGGLIRSKRAAEEVLVDDISPQYEGESGSFDPFILEYPSQEVTTAMAHMPDSLRRVVELFFTEEGRRVLRSPFRQRLNAPDETEGERLNRLANWPKELDFYDELRNYLFVG